MIVLLSFIRCNAPQQQTRRLVLAVLLVVLWTIGTVSWIPGSRHTHAQQPAGQSQGQVDLQRLEGRWVRPDGGYVLELREVTKEGGLKAAYFNPWTIHVARAELRREEDRALVIVELRDVNYPGSTYTLHYDPGSDRLKGTYFQAVERKTFIVEFLRAK